MEGTTWLVTASSARPGLVRQGRASDEYDEHDVRRPRLDIDFRPWNLLPQSVASDGDGAR
jgi:hypothetical protein